MGEAGDRQIERAINRNLPGRGSQQIATAHHLTDGHGAVVVDDRQLVGGHAVSPAQDEIVLKGDALAVADETDSGPSTRRARPACHLVRPQCPTRAGVPGPFFVVVRRRDGATDVAAGTGARKRTTRRQ